MNIRLNAKLILGLCGIVAGTLLVLDNLTMIESEPILKWWPAVLVAFGLIKWLGLGTDRQQGTGLLLIAGGGWLLANAAGWVHFGIFGLWPIFLVIAGVAMLRSAFRSGEKTDGSTSRMSMFALMSGVGRKISGVFEGGEATAVMGGCEIDLTQARLGPNGKAQIEVFVMWGGIDLKIPEGWVVTPKAIVMMGALDDQTKPSGLATGEIEFSGLVLMGGNEVKN